jgi:hypothetical protein
MLAAYEEAQPSPARPTASIASGSNSSPVNLLRHIRTEATGTYAFFNVKRDLRRR